MPRAGELYLDPAAWRGAREQFAHVDLDVIDIRAGEDARQGVLQVKSFTTDDLGVAAAAGRDTSIRPLVDRMHAWELDGERVRLVVHDRAQANRLRGLLAVHEVETPILDRAFPAVPPEVRRAILIGELSAGFRLPVDRLTLVAGEEIFGERRRRRGRSIDVGKFLASLAELKPDDLVVHIDHGIGRYKGLRHLAVADTEGDYLHLEYHGGDRLYVPVDRINVVEKYVGADGSAPDLDKLGGTAWEKVKAKTREAVMEMAHELLDIYAAREVMEGHAFGAPDQYFREFEARFPFEETPDQQRAIEDVIADLQKQRPMDRLVCGDVGFGKTEVALRAAFAVVMDGKQVAVLVPTTVLAQQHYETFRSALRRLSRCASSCCSRFRRGEEAKQVLARHAARRGRHRRRHAPAAPGRRRASRTSGSWSSTRSTASASRTRRSIKKLQEGRRRADAHRHAHPAHAAHGAGRHARPLHHRDARRSTGRRSARSSPATTNRVIREAALREIARGGQVFFVHNRVETIDAVARRLREIVPEARVGVAHGQMNARARSRR